jgi:hypothetical protein
MIMCYLHPSLYDDDEVRYILQDIEDSMDKKEVELFEQLSTSKKNRTQLDLRIWK